MLPILLALTLVLGSEQQTAPHAYQPHPMTLAAPAVSLARDGHGVAMAWSMPDAGGVPRIHVARLDGRGNPGAIRELPVYLNNESTAALYPSISRRTGADGFLVTWIEHRGTRSRVAYALLDAALAPNAPELLPGVGISAPPLAGAGDAMWIAAEFNLWQIDANGAASGPVNGVWPASDMTVTTGLPRTVSAYREGPGYHCTCMAVPWSGGVCAASCRVPVYPLRLVLPNQAANTRTFSFWTEAYPAIETDGEILVMAWFRGDQASGGEVVASMLNPAMPDVFGSVVQAPAVLGQFGRDSGPTRPDTAMTDRGTAIVWRTTSPLGDHDIAGALLRRDGSVETFTVAASAADERDPSVLALENGALLIAYRKVENGQSRLAWRIVGSQGRRRAVR
jgi:hypothetical protein